jgi:hypothetical protein
MNDFHLLGVRTARTLTDHRIYQHHSNSNCTSRTNWFDLPATPCLVFQTERLTAFETINARLALTFEEDPSIANFWDLSVVHSPWNVDWTDAGREGRGLGITNAVLGHYWTHYGGLH